MRNREITVRTGQMSGGYYLYNVNLPENKGIEIYKIPVQNADTFEKETVTAVQYIQENFNSSKLQNRIRTSVSGGIISGIAAGALCKRKALSVCIGALAGYFAGMFYAFMPLIIKGCEYAGKLAEIGAERIGITDGGI